MLSITPFFITTTDVFPAIILVLFNPRIMILHTLKSTTLRVKREKRKEEEKFEMSYKGFSKRTPGKSEKRVKNGITTVPGSCKLL